MSCICPRNAEATAGEKNVSKILQHSVIQESLADLEVGCSGPTHPVKVERVKYLTREIQVKATMNPIKTKCSVTGGNPEDEGMEHRSAGGVGQKSDRLGGGGGRYRTLPCIGPA